MQTNLPLRRVAAGALLFAALGLQGCASTYSDLVSGSKLGAADYRPAVLVKEGFHGKYEQVLTVCRQAAVNKQITSAQEAQLKTLTGVAGGAMDGVARGMEMGSLFKQAGLNTSINRSAGIGLATGLLSSLASSFASGTENAAEETRVVLLRCLRAADPASEHYQVLE